MGFVRLEVKRLHIKILYCVHCNVHGRTLQTEVLVCAVLSKLPMRPLVTTWLSDRIVKSYIYL